MLEWLAELETVFLLGVLQSQAEAWKVYLDNFRRLSLGKSYLKSFLIIAVLKYLDVEN